MSSVNRRFTAIFKQYFPNIFCNKYIFFKIDCVRSKHNGDNEPRQNLEMDIGDAITVTKLYIQDGRCYLMIGWQKNSFEMYLFTKDKLWKGKFSPNRLSGFSKNLNMSEADYFQSLKNCLSQQKDDYRYELKSGFFYWKRKTKGGMVIEGFMPVEIDNTPYNARPDLIEVLLALNGHNKQKVISLRSKYRTLKTDYEKCLKDTEEFLSLKIDMEKALCDKFLNLLNIKKSKIEMMEDETSGKKSNSKSLKQKSKV